MPEMNRSKNRAVGEWLASRDAAWKAMKEAFEELDVDLEELEWYDGEVFIRFYPVEVRVNEHSQTVTAMVENRGRAGMRTFDLQWDGARLFFLYGPEEARIYLDEECQSFCSKQEDGRR